MFLLSLDPVFFLRGEGVDKVVYVFATCIADAVFRSGVSKQRAILDMKQATELLDRSNFALGRARNLEDTALNVLKRPVVMADSQRFHVLPTQCIYVFSVDLRTNSDYFPIQH